MADACSLSFCMTATTEVWKLVIWNAIRNEIINIPICLVRRIVYVWTMKNVTTSRKF